MAGSTIPAFTHEVKWTPVKLSLSTGFLSIFYAFLLALTISTKIKMPIALTIAVPISLGAFISLLYWFNPNYG